MFLDVVTWGEKQTKKKLSIALGSLPITRKHKRDKEQV